MHRVGLKPDLHRFALPQPAHLPSANRRSILPFPVVIPLPKAAARVADHIEENSVSVQVSLTVNGTTANADIDERTLLVELLRNQLALTGTHVGCDTAQCG